MENLHGETVNCHSGTLQREVSIGNCEKLKFYHDGNASVILLERVVPNGEDDIDFEGEAISPDHAYQLIKIYG